MTESLNHITHTIQGYLVKDLRYLPIDNIIVGLVQDKEFGNSARDFYISVQWTKQGKPIKLNKGRNELILKIK